jgi:hypothetical protein
MRNLSWERESAKRRERPPQYENDWPAPAQVFTRLGLLLVIALAFGLVAELLARLPPQ